MAPEKFFTELGASIAEEIADLTEELVEPNLLSADYLKNLSVWNDAKSRATEIVLQDRFGEPEEEEG